MSVNWLLSRILLVSVIPLILFFSCKKDRLTGDKEILIGKWEWLYSVRITSCGCNAGTETYDTLSPISENANYHMEFKKKGIVKFYKNDVKIEKKRIVFYSWGDLDAPAIDISILLDNKQFLSGVLNDKYHSFSLDTMVTWRYFPFKMGEDCGSGGCIYYNYFVRK